MKTFIFRIFAFSLLFSSCMFPMHNPNVMQTAKPVEKGKFEASAYHFVGNYYMTSFPADASTGYTSFISLFPTIMGRYGLKDGLDAGFKMKLNQGTFDVKYNFFKSKDEKFYLSTGLGLDIGAANGSYYDVFLPLYFSMDKKNYGVYGAAKIGYRHWNFNNDSDVYLSGKSPVSSSKDSFQKENVFYSGALGFYVGGNKLKIFAELAVDFDKSYSYLFGDRYYYSSAPNQRIKYILQPAFGIKLNFGK